jgi:toxin ParE1/3/4
VELARPTYGARLTLATQEALEMIQRFPAIGTKFRKTPCRTYLLRKFPYTVVYSVEGTVLKIWAFAHYKRKPGYWKQRLPKN